MTRRTRVVRGGRRIVTLTSDTGSVYAAQMRAVLAQSLHAAEIFDLAHDLPAHGIREAGFLLRAMAERFPAGSIHIAVIDPGVGGARAPIVIECRDGSVLVGPDNGVLWPLAERLGYRSAYRIDARRLPPRHRVGRTFDGRDLFAPAAARIARGSPPSELGPRVRPRRVRLPPARIREGALTGEVLHVDRFGNLVTSIPSKAWPAGARSAQLRLRADPPRTLPFARSYEALGIGRLGILPSSFGLLEIAIGQGSAARHLEARSADRIEVRVSDAQLRGRGASSRRRSSDSSRPRVPRVLASFVGHRRPKAVRL